MEPFARLESVGLIMGPDGRKMSKRFGNVINPDDVVKTYGADTLRLYEMFMGPFDQAIAWSEEAIIGPRRFLERVWKVASQVEKNFAALPASGLRHGLNFSPPASLTKLLHKTIKKVSEDIAEMKFNTAISSMMIFVNEVEKSNSISRGDFKQFLKILAPFAPHMTEELWQQFGGKRSDLKGAQGLTLKSQDSIHLSSWPEYDKEKIKEEKVKIVIQINGKVRGEIIIEVDEKEEEIKQKALESESVLRHTVGKSVKKVIYIKNRLINIVV